MGKHSGMAVACLKRIAGEVRRKRRGDNQIRNRLASCRQPGIARSIGLLQGQPFALPVEPDSSGENRLQSLLARRFGVLPDTVRARLDKATAEQLESWALKVLNARSLDEAFDQRRKHESGSMRQIGRASCRERV